MAKFRMVHTDFWKDSVVVEEMTPEDKYFYLYLLTNGNTTQIGIYQITRKEMGFDLGYSVESINSLLDRFINNHKLIAYNYETRELAVKNWGKYNLTRGGKPMLDCVSTELKKVKDLSLISFVAPSVPNITIKSIYDSYNDTKVCDNDTCNVTQSDFTKTEESSNDEGPCDTSDDTLTTRGQYKEKEEEQEEYKEKEIYKEKDPVRDLFDHYVSKNIIQHKKITNSMRSTIKARLKDYSFDELKRAIDNYALVLISNRHWFTHKYPLADFMRDKDVRKFLDESDPLNNFMISSKTFTAATNHAKHNYRQDAF